MIMIDKNNNVVVDISHNIFVDGVHIGVEKQNETIYYMNRDIDIVNVDALENIKAQKHKYIEGQFVINPDYKEPIIETEQPNI